MRFMGRLMGAVALLLAAGAAQAAPGPLPSDGKVHKTLLGLEPGGIQVSCPGGQGDATFDSQQRWALNLPNPADTTRCRLIVIFSINPLYDRKEFGRLFAEKNGLVTIRFDGSEDLFQTRYAEGGGPSGEGPSWHIRSDGVVHFSIGVTWLVERGRSFSLTFGMRGADGQTQFYSAPIRIAVPAPTALPGIAAAPDSGQPRIAFRAYRVTITCPGQIPVEFDKIQGAWLAPNAFGLERSRDCLVDLFFERHPQASDSTAQLTRALRDQGLRWRRHLATGQSTQLQFDPVGRPPSYNLMGDARFVAILTPALILTQPGAEIDIYVPISERTWLMTEPIALRFLW